jgi:hypothetical protein
MKTMFEMNLYGHTGIGRFSGPALGASVKIAPRMGQDLIEGARGIWEGLLSGFAGLIQDVPPEVAGTYRDRLKACQNMLSTNPSTSDYVKATTCLRTLYKDIQEGKVATPPVVTPPPAKASTFPIVPIAIAGVGLIALVLILMKAK